MRKRLWYALSALLIVGVVGVLILLDLPGAPRPLPCHTWQSMATAQLSGLPQFSSIALLAPNDVWIAGTNYKAPSRFYRPLVEHWDGKHWQTSFPPDTGNFAGASVNSIATISDSDVWVVGGIFVTYSSQTPLATHWDGHAWRARPLPSLPGEKNQFDFTVLYGITALAGDNVWAVGTTPGKDFSETLVEHWDGSAWRRIPSPNVADENNYLTSVTALSANDIWAVGISMGYRGAALTLTEHWDGAQWSIVPSPDPSRFANHLSSVAAAGPNDVWAVGAMEPPLTDLTLTGGSKPADDPIRIESDGLILHWDGQSWQTSSFPKLGDHQVLTSITAYSSVEVWAAGLFVTDSDQGQVWHGFLLHWDGSAWHSAEDAHAQYVYGIATSAAGGLWSVGVSLASPLATGSAQAVVESCV